MRTVIVLEMVRKPESIEFERKEKCRGKFHGWGVSGKLHTVALVELGDGSMLTPPVEMVKFCD